MNDPTIKWVNVFCPKCHHQMVEHNPMLLLLSNPPKKNIFCPECNHSEYVMDEMLYTPTCRCGEPVYKDAGFNICFECFTQNENCFI